MQLFKQKTNNFKSTQKLKFSKKGLFNKKRVIPFIVIFGLLGGYLVYRSFAYTPVLLGSDGEFVPLAPARIMDTRNGTGGYKVAIPANGTYALQVTGAGGVPDVKGVKSVVLNAVVTGPTAGGYLTAYPSDIRTAPKASNINYSTGQTIGNQITVRVGADGKVKFTSSASTHIIVDVAGYYSSETGVSGTRFNALVPARIVDTRSGVGGYKGTVGAKKTIPIQIAGQGQVPLTGAKAVVINLVAVGSTAGGYATVWPSGTTLPVASSINYGVGGALAKTVTVPVGADGKIQLYSSSGSPHFVIDVTGYYEAVDAVDAKTQAGRFMAVDPKRIMDTRDGTGGKKGIIGANQTYALSINSCPMPQANIRAIVVNVVTTGSTVGGYLSAWPSGLSNPGTSALNYSAGQTIGNQVILKVGTDGKVVFYASSSSHIIVDIAGCFIDYEDQANDSSGLQASLTPCGRLDYCESVNVINQKSFDLNIKSYPTSKRSYISTHDYSSSPTNYNESMNTNYEIAKSPGADSVLNIICQGTFADTCKTLGPKGGTARLDGSNAYISGVPFKFDAGNTYKFISTITDNAVGYEGRWVTLSISANNNTSTPVLTYKVSIDAVIQFGAQFFTRMDGYDCKSSSLFEVSFGNLVVDNKKDYTYRPYMRNGTSMSCPGYAKISYTSGALISNPSIFTLSYGVPKISRDSMAPVINKFTYDGQTTGYTGQLSNINLSSDVTDSSELVMLCLEIDGSGCWFFSPLGSNGYYSKVAKHSFDQLSLNLLAGTHKVTLIARDQSGNESSKTIDINIPEVMKITLNVSPDYIAAGESTDITWSVTGNPSSCVAYGDWTGEKGVSGSFSTGPLTVPDDFANTYNLECTNSGGKMVAISYLYFWVPDSGGMGGGDEGL